MLAAIATIALIVVIKIVLKALNTPAKPQPNGKHWTEQYR